MLRALAASACAHHAHRHRRGARDARRRRDLHGARPRARRRQADSEFGGFHARRRRAHRDAAASCAGRRHRALRRRGGGRGDRGDRRRRRATPRKGSTSTTSRCRGRRYACRNRRPAHRPSWRTRPDNIACEARHGDAAAAEAAFARAAHVVALDLVNQRVAPCPIEPRSTLATCDAASGRAHAARQLPDADRVARRAVRRGARHSEGERARGRRRRRRRLRHEDEPVSGGRRRRVRRARAEAAGAVHRRAHGGIPGGEPRPRRDEQGRARARRQRPHPGAADRDRSPTSAPTRRPRAWSSSC